MPRPVTPLMILTRTSAIVEISWKLNAFAASCGLYEPGRGQREDQTGAEDPGEQRREVRETGGAAAGLLADLGPDEGLVGRVHAQRLGRHGGR